MSNYEPIACGAHEQYQFAVLKRVWLDLEWIDEAGEKRSRRLLPRDVRTRNRAEYLVAEDRDGVCFEIRLDWIRRAARAMDGVSLLD